MQGEILAAVLIIIALAAYCWLLRGVLLTPVKPGNNAKINVLLTVSGAAPTLEQTVDALIWLKANGTLPFCEILLADRGMDKDAAAVAEILARSGAIRIID